VGSLPDGNLVQLTLSPDRYTVVLEVDADGAYREVISVPVPSIPTGTKILSWGFVEAQAQSSSLNPRVTSSTRFALCSRNPAHEITSLAGARGGCGAGGDLAILHVEAVQSAFGATNMVAG